MTAGSKIRVDKWLWYARVTKSRALASQLARGGKIRVNRIKINGAAKPVGPGDVLTISLRGRVRVLKILATGSRRGPAAEARLLYEDLTPVLPSRAGPHDLPPAAAAARPARDKGSGRPTKKERRQLQALTRDGT